MTQGPASASVVSPATHPRHKTHQLRVGGILFFNYHVAIPNFLSRYALVLNQHAFKSATDITLHKSKESTFEVCEQDRKESLYTSSKASVMHLITHVHSETPGYFCSRNVV
ncbi:hypothetical protein B0O80DRAFT_428323 [Mortierella sp. GBAus27b]|nr:hypothetical protein B0O80DRAFT_428323 [Mortierella sp. GBAus27b]